MAVSSWTENFLTDGFQQFPSLVDLKLVARAREYIDRDLRVNYDASRIVEYDNRSFCPDLLGTPEIQDLASCPGVKSKLEELFEPESVVCDDGQIAIRRAHNSAERHGPVAHIDGIPTSTNGMNGDELTPFTLLLAVFLSEVRAEFSGNFTVWPGTHTLMQEYFRKRGPKARSEGMPQVALGTPRQLLCKPGDVVLCHYSLAHAAAVNTSDFDRYAVFFRLSHRTLDREKYKDAHETEWAHLTNIWTDWKIAPPLTGTRKRLS